MALIRDVRLHGQLQRIRRCIYERCATALAINATRFGVLDIGAKFPGIALRIGEALVEPIGAARHRRHAHCKLTFDDREFDGTARILPPEAAERDVCDAAEFTGGLLRDDAHSTADGVLTEQSALRAAQHLNALDDEQFEDRARSTREIDAVDIDADAWVLRDDEVRLTDTAQKDLGEVAATAAVTGV